MSTSAPAAPDAPAPPSPCLSLPTLLGPKGQIAATWPGFVPRAQQLAVARAVDDALLQGTPCLAEAGTGVGKTLAYLVPLVRWLQQTGKRAVVSTHTLALQSQLVDRDIPNLLATLPQYPIKASVLKGRANFLCLQDLDVAASEIWTAGDPQFRQIQRWSNETDTGDVSELDFTYSAWMDIAANKDTCRGADCRHFQRCFYYRARRAAEDAQLLVVNHSLFFADLRLRRLMPGLPTLIPDYDAVVFDEAHHVEDTATRAFGLEWGSRRVPQLLFRARRVPGIEKERLDALDALNEALMAPLVGAQKPEAFLSEALGGEGDEKLFREFQEDVCSHLNALARDLTKSAEAANDSTDRDRANGLARVASRLSTELKEVTRPEPEPQNANDKLSAASGYFRWYQTRKNRAGQMATLTRTPIEVGPLLRESLFLEVPRTILVSATLSSGGGFEYLKKRLGITLPPGPAPEYLDAMPSPDPIQDTPSDDEHEHEPLKDVPPPVEVRVGSPFDFRQNCLLYVPRTLGAPVSGASPDYEDKVAAHIEQIVGYAQGRTFALFTSHRMLRAVEERLRDTSPYPLFVQGDMPTLRLVQAFKDAGNGVLLGTASFWEGVDVAGPALSCVIMDKLPFPTPDSPLQRAREQAIKDAGGNSFRDLSLPQTQIRLKQGFGRLLRTITDRGVVAILDERLWTKYYGRDLLADLPPCPRTDDLRDIADFFAEEAAAAGQKNDREETV